MGRLLGDTALPHHSPRSTGYSRWRCCRTTTSSGSIPKHTPCKEPCRLQHLLPPAHPRCLLTPAPAWPAKLLVQLLSIQSWSKWASTVACYWSWWLHEEELGKDSVELEGLGGEGNRSCPQRDGDKVLDDILFGQHSWHQDRRKTLSLNSLLTPTRHSPESSKGREVSLFPKPQRTNSGAKNPILFIYFCFNPCRHLTTKIFTAVLWFWWRHILLSLV